MNKNLASGKMIRVSSALTFHGEIPHQHGNVLAKLHGNKILVISPAAMSPD